MLYAGAMAISKSCGQDQLIIEHRGEMKLDFQRTDDQHEPGGLQFPIREPGCAQHLHPSSFKVVQVLGVMDSPLPVDFVIVDADGKFVLFQHVLTDR